MNVSVFNIFENLGGEYRYLPYSVPAGKFCDIITNDKYVYPDIVKHSNFPKDVAANCPIPPVSFSLMTVKLL